MASGEQNLVTCGLGGGATLTCQGYGDIPPPPPSQYGTISVTTTGVLTGPVFVDGVLLGAAPQSPFATVGPHVVSFGGVSGWTTPADVSVGVLLGATHDVVGDYVAIGTFATPFLVCPTCNSPLGVHRLGRTGVPESLYGKRRDTHDSTLFRCDFCKTTFRGQGITLSEAMGP